MDALHSQYEAALKDWQSKYERSERDLAEARMGQHNIHDMERELARLRGDLDAANKVTSDHNYSDADNIVTQARNAEAMRASDLETRLRATETQLSQR